jgi:hypothetical protein
MNTDMVSSPWHPKIPLSKVPMRNILTSEERRMIKIDNCDI